MVRRRAPWRVSLTLMSERAARGRSPHPTLRARAPARKGSPARGRPRRDTACGGCGPARPQWAVARSRFGLGCRCGRVPLVSFWVPKGHPEGRKERNRRSGGYAAASAPLVPLTAMAGKSHDVDETTKRSNKYSRTHGAPPPLESSGNIIAGSDPQARGAPHMGPVDGPRRTRCTPPAPPTGLSD